jgi:hypothetical protein
MKKPLKLLTSLLVYRGEEHTRKCIDRLIGKSDLLILDNGSDLQSLLNEYDCLKIVNEKNVLVNPGFNQLMEYFLAGDWDRLAIVNSDFILRDGWVNTINVDFIPVPSDGSISVQKEVFEGTPGVFMCLTREMVKAVYPIPDYIKIWFGDTWVYDVLRGLGHKTIILPDLVGVHWCSGSQDIVHTPNVYEIIEEDKRKWAINGYEDIKKRIEQVKNGK